MHWRAGRAVLLHHLQAPENAWTFNTISLMKRLLSLIPSSQACSLKIVKQVGFLAPRGHWPRGRSPTHWCGLAKGCPLYEASQDAPLTGIRGLSSRSGLGRDPRKEEQGAFHLPQASPGPPGLSGSSRCSTASEAAYFLTTPFPRPSPHARRARSRGGRAGGARARGRRRKANRALRRGGERAGAFPPAAARIPRFSALQGKRSVLGALERRVEVRRVWGLASGLLAPFHSENGALGLPSPARRLAWGSGEGRGDGGATLDWSGLAASFLGSLRVGPAGEGESAIRKGPFGDTCSPGVAALPGCGVHPEGRTFQTKRNKFGPGRWTADFSVWTPPRGKVGLKTLLSPAWQFRGSRMG